jgi:hypothetical protein
MKITKIYAIVTADRQDSKINFIKLMQSTDKRQSQKPQPQLMTAVVQQNDSQIE